jgi:hypothetical protein
MCAGFGCVWATYFFSNVTLTSVAELFNHCFRMNTCKFIGNVVPCSFYLKQDKFYE